MVIADVSGKGISAALLMAFVRPVLRAALDRTGAPIEALGRTNRILVEERPTGLFVTVLCGVVDLDAGLFTFANAGHEAPLRVPADGPGTTRLEARGSMLGAFRELGLEERQVELDVGDQLVLYTDGITDAAAPNGERFGETRLREILDRQRGRAAEAVCHSVIGDVLAFQADADPADDLALLVLRRVA
jgi:phosphoserine phosphatase RsbU/P